MNRPVLQRLALDRIRDARVLLAAKQWSAAFYLAGYAVECALKSCILARIEAAGVIFIDRKYSDKCWTHNLNDLIKLAGLQEKWNQDKSANPILGENWVVVTKWDESARYRRTNFRDAKKLVRAITDKSNGVMTWLRNHW